MAFALSTGGAPSCAHPQLFPRRAAAAMTAGSSPPRVPVWPLGPSQSWKGSGAQGSAASGGSGAAVLTGGMARGAGKGLHTRRGSQHQLHAAVEDDPAVEEWRGGAATLEEWGRKEAARCDAGDPDIELCELPEIIDAMPPAERSAADEAWTRGRWLLGLLVLQSMSSVVLDSYQGLLKDHLVVTLFLTMLVGAGGNAGNQSAIKVIRGLATGAMKPTGPGVRRALAQQLAVGLMLGAGLAAGGWVRVYLTNGDALNATAISISLFLIVLTSVVAGTALPFALARAGVDPANAGTSIQVVMDISGVLITCATCHLVLDQLAAGLRATG